MSHTASDFTVDKRVEELKKTVQDRLREGLKGYVGETNTEEGRQKVMAAVAEVLDGFLNTGILPTYEIQVAQEAGEIILVGVLQNVRPADRTEHKVRLEGYLNDKGVLTFTRQKIFTYQKATYPEGEPVIPEDMVAAFDRVEASEKNAKRVMSVLAAFDEEDKRS